MSPMSGPTRVAVIMAGGSGERFWPLSRRLMPKQLLKLADPDRTLLQEAVDRIAPVIPLGRVFVATARHLQQAVRRAGLGIPDENVLAEPCKRNTAGCLAYAAGQLLHRFGGDGSGLVMATVTADHAIGDPDAFGATAEAAMAAAEAEDALVTIGIQPTRPETGYGYIEVPEGAAPAAGSAATRPVYPVAQFREKPDAATAQQFIESGRFFWNSGMFFWRMSTFLAELDRAAPAFSRTAREIADALTRDDAEAADRVFEALENVSIDYALMERSRNVLVARGDFPWDDVGAWSALDRSLPHDASGNVTAGEPVLIDTTGSIVYNAAGDDRMAVAVLGCRDVVVVACEDGVLVMPKDRAQDAKQVVAELRARGSDRL